MMATDNNNKPTANNSSSSSALRHQSISFYLSIVLICAIVVNVVPSVHGDGEWMKDCGVCHCKYSSSKKTADCKNISLTGVPRGVSNELQVIELSYNVIAELRRSEFQDANLINLHKIYLNNCTLQEIHRDAFKGLHLLIELDLSNNFLKTLQPGLFLDLIRLRVFTAVNNQLDQLDDYLFANMSYLAKVDVSSNRLQYIGQHAFFNVTKLKEIDMQTNRLSVLRADTFRSLDNLGSLTLYDNPWNCTCELQQFREFVISKSLYTPPTNCQDPMHLRGKLWTAVSAENFACEPRILSPRDGATIDASDNVTIECRVRGTPKPVIEWTYNGESLIDDGDRILVRNMQETSRRDAVDIYISELTISDVRSTDRGTYTCLATNNGGKTKSNVQLTYAPVSEVINGFGLGGISSTVGIPTTHATNLLLLICLVAIILLTMLIIVVLILFCYCRRVKKYSKNGSISENGLMTSKIDRSQDGSMLEGSVIMEMQKSLLTEVNPVEKPPRRNEIDGKSVPIDDGHELKKTLLDEQVYGNHEDETHSIALSDATPRSRATFVDDGYGTNLPPDLLSFPSRFPQSPSTQSSISNIPDGSLYIKSPVASPIYQHNPYGVAQAGYRTLQHPKNRNLAIINRNNNSPFQPAPILYAPVVMKQGYVTIPRKPRTPSWAPSFASTMIDFPPTSPTSTMSTELAIDPIYDNLGLRTTASGHSTLSVNKQPTANSATAAATAAAASASNAIPISYTMKDRPLPATPIIYEPLQEQQIANIGGDETELLFKVVEPQTVMVSANAIAGANSSSQPTSVELRSLPTKVPPRPPPKPKKKMPTISAITENPEQTTENGDKKYQDEDDDGTEV